MAFSVVSGTVFAEGPLDISAASEAASYNKTMLPYCYQKLTNEEKLAYLKLRTAYIECRSSLDIEIPTATMNKLSNILMYADVLTSFNYPVGKGNFKYYYYEETSMTSRVMFKYLYSKKDYDLIIKKSNKAAEKIISQFTEKTTDYEKIKLIHDHIIDNTEYYDNKSNSSVYDALVQGSAKCDGYTHAFDYICAKAGIRTAIVYGYTKDRASESEYHVWNKVYCNKKWYNVDVTWDDPLNNLKDNKYYKYFMISDRTISRSHVEIDRGFYVPAAEAEDGDYYRKYGCYAKTLNEAKSIFADKIGEAAKNGGTSVTVRLADEQLLNTVNKRFEDTNDMFDILDRASKKAGGGIITDGYLYETDSDYCLYTVYFYYTGTKLSDYYIDVSQEDSGNISFLKDLGIKDA